MFALTAREETFLGYSYAIFEKMYLAKGYNLSGEILFEQFSEQRPARNKPEMIKILKNNWNKMVII